MPDLQKLISLARGKGEADLLVKNCRLVNTLSGEVHRADMAVAHGLVIGFGDYRAGRVLDAGGRFVCPGLVEGHIHIESTMLSPSEFARAVAGRGTSAAVCDPHEIANVLGLEGIEYMIQAALGLPVALYFMAPSCVPATHLETSGAEVSAEDITRLFKKYPDRVLGLAEMMNYPGVLSADPEVMAKIKAAQGRPIDGHAPMLGGKDLCAYILAGPGSDHECTDIDEAREKLRLGMHVMIREGTSEHNLAELASLALGPALDRLSLVSDDRHPDDLLTNGHLDRSVRMAIELGVDPVIAVRMASINPARYFGLKGRGALAPGYRADFIVLDDLETFAVQSVYLGGRELSELDFETDATPPGNSMHAGLAPGMFRVPAKPGKIRAIGVMPGQIVTEERVFKPAIKDGFVIADPARDLVKLAVIERHHASGNTGLGFAHGLGLERGAVASTVAHDSHNLVVAGTSDDDMLAAAGRACEIGGGLVVVEQGGVLAELALPIAGLMSASSLDETAAGLTRVNRAAASLGGSVVENLFMHLSFLALPVIPRLKLTDKGLVDVDKFELTGLFMS